MRKSKYSSVSDINVTSLVDVTMVLLIIFMLTAPFIQAGIKVKLPKAKSTVIKETEAVVISVNDKAEVFINNERVQDEQLGPALETLAVAGEERVYVRADGDVPYKVVMNVIGEVDGRTCVIVDDLVDTGGTLVGSARALSEKGATSVVACFTHPVLSGPAMERIAAKEIARIVVTDTIPLASDKAQDSKITVLSVANLLGEAIARIHSNSSVSSLFV